MKTLIPTLAPLSLALALLAGPAFAADPPAAAPDSTAKTGDAAPPAPEPVKKKKGKKKAAKAAAAAAAAVDAAAKAPEPAAPATAVTAAPAADKNANLRLNFRGVPLEMVLDYLSEAAGFTIVLETPVSGKVDVWNNQPVTKTEAVNLLNTVLAKNGFTALQNGRTLTIVKSDDAKKRNIPVKAGADPEAIPRSDEIVTQIIPVRYINATQVTKDLQPLLPASATLTANEAGNSLVITDTQANIHRMAEIIKALDSSGGGIASNRVFKLQFADAKAVATVVKEVFDQSARGSSSGRSSGGGGGDPRAEFLSRITGGGGPGGGDRGSRSGSGSSSRTSAASRVVATADERSNALIVSAPEELMPIIEDLVKDLDTNVDDLTEIRVFKLQHADPVEMAEVLGNLFPDESKSNSQNQSSRFASFFGGPPGSPPGGGRSGSGGGSTESDRQKKQGKVIAVPDQRTASVIVTASHELMRQIEQMIQQLDANPAKKQKVFVYSLENADTQEVEQVLKSLFESQNASRNGRSSTSTQNSPLTTRSTTQSQNQGSSATSRGGSSSGVGGRSSGGAGGGSFP